MATSRQLAANRRNAKKSTGPKTDAGKAVVALNAVKHGLLSTEVLLPCEDESTLVEFGKRMRSELKPQGELELLLTDRVIASAWRLRRAYKVEADLLGVRSGMSPMHGRDFGLAYAFVMHGGPTNIGALVRYESSIERAMYRALHELQRLQAARTGQNVPPPAVVDVDVSLSQERD